MKRGFSFSLPVIFVVSAIVYIYFSTVFIFIERWFGLMSSPGIFNAVVFSVGGDLRYCQKCSHFKPPRAHHCRVCRRCVLRMDHHCIWIHNCFGHANYKVFFVFVLYAVIACFYALVLLVGNLTIGSPKDEQPSGDSFRTAYVISGLLLVPLCVALSILLGWHIYLILHNKTTIEFHEGVRAMWLAEKGGNVYKHPYDLGAFENLTTAAGQFRTEALVVFIHNHNFDMVICSFIILCNLARADWPVIPWVLRGSENCVQWVLGPNVLSWLCPILRHIGSGLRFQNAYDDLTGASTSKQLD